MLGYHSSTKEYQQLEGDGGKKGITEGIGHVSDGV